MLALVNGAILTAGLIVSIGPQNIELIRTGLLKQQAFLLASVYVMCDVLLITLGAVGLGTFITLNPMLQKISALAVTILLLYLALSALKRVKAIKQNSQNSNNVLNIKANNNGVSTVKRGLMLSLFNPLALLETVLIIGGVSGQYHNSNKALFILGAICTSLIWFYGIAFSATKLSVFLQQPKQQCRLEYFTAFILLVIALLIGFKFL